jgi:dTMP kinase
MSAKPTHFIAVDGIDGVGKSTQIRGIERAMSELGYDCESTRDPGSSEIGQRLRGLLLETNLTMHRRTEAMLFIASRCEMVQATIKPRLASGVSIISDRFLLSTVVYQSVGKPSESVSPDLVWQIGELANDGVRPDLTILLDMPAEAAMKRIDRPTDRMESRGVRYMESVRQAFLEQLPRASEATVVIDADQPPEQVAVEIRAALETYLDAST